MSNPVIISCSEGEWTKVATNVTTGNIRKISFTPEIYLQTYRLTGEAAPTLEDEGCRLFQDFVDEGISATEGIDIYVWTKGEDGVVRVDL